MKKRNLLLAASTLPAVMALAGLSAACQKRFDQVNDGEIVINAGFTQSGPQGRALDEIVKKYNEWIQRPENQNKGYMKARIVTNPNGYSTNDLATKLLSKERRTLWNLMFNYPTAAAIIAEHDMNLKFNDSDYDSYGLSSAFKDVNKTIAYNTNNEKWVVPVARSSEMNAVNQIVIGKLLKALKDDYKVKFKDGNKTLLDKYVKAYEYSTSDKTSVDNIWDASKIDEGPAKEALKKELENYEISDDVFENYVDLIKMVNYMKRAFPKDKSLYVLGIDSVANSVYSMIKSLVKGDLTKEIVTPDENYIGTGGYDYTSFHRNKDSAQYKLFKKVIEYIIEGINSGSIWIGGGGAYGSSNLTRHKLGFSIGSTAGFSHTFATSGLTFKKYKANGLTEEVRVPDNSSNEIKTTTDANLLAEIQSGKYTNKIYPSTHTGSITRFDKQAVDAAADSLIKGLNTEASSYIVSDSNLSNKTGSVTVKNTPIPGAKFLGKIFKNDNKDYFFIPKAAVESVALSDGQVANKNEVDWISAPKKANNTSEETASYVAQGPSLVGVHANDEEDEATRKFVNWFFKEKMEYEFGSGSSKTTEKVTSLEMFNRKGNYIAPTSEYLSKDVSTLGNLNEAQKLAFENFKKADTDNANNKIVEDVSSKLSELLRSNIQSTLQGLASSVAIQGKVVDFNEFLSNFQSLFNEQTA